LIELSLHESSTREQQAANTTDILALAESNATQIQASQIILCYISGLAGMQFQGEFY